MIINARSVSIPADWAEASLLDYLRDHLQLTGTKYGCGIGICGACTVHVDGQATRACVVPVAEVKDKEITTIEGLAGGSSLHPVQRAWIECAVLAMCYGKLASRS